MKRSIAPRSPNNNSKLRRVPTAFPFMLCLLLCTLSVTANAKAELLHFNILNGSGHLDPFGADPNRTISVDEVQGVIGFNTDTNLFDLHLQFDGVIHALNGGTIDILSAGLQAWGGPNTTRNGHEPLRVANEANNILLRGFADGTPGPKGNHGDAFINDAIGRGIPLALGDMFFAANPLERTLYVDIGRVFAPGHVPGTGFLTLQYEPLVFEAPHPSPPSEIPEPASLALLLTGLLGSAAKKRRSNAILSPQSP